MTAEHAIHYHEGGWHPLELPANEKSPPPEGRTGRDGIDMPLNEIALGAWYGNIGLRMPVDVIGLDVDAYNGGKVTLDEMVARLGPLPRTWISHSGRNDGSGIRFYRVPVGMSWISGLPGIEIIQRSHRYAVVWPSTHPDGRPYSWYDQAEKAPSSNPQVEDLPELPWAWIEELSRADAGTSSRAVGQSVAAAFLEAHDKGDAPSYITVINQDFLDKTGAGHSRHDTMQHCLTWAMDCAAAEVVNARVAVHELSDLWVVAVRNEPRRRELWATHRTTEFEAMLRHAIGKAEAKTEDELFELHDSIAGIPINATKHTPPAPPLIDDYQSTPTSSIWIDWSTFADRDDQPRDWLVEDFWPWGKAMALWAGAKTGKSELALWCAVKLAIGEHPWTGDPVEPIDVAYFDYEMDGNDLEDRLVTFNIAHSRLVHLHYALLPPLAFLDTEIGGRQVAAAVAEVGAKAAVFDTFSRAVGGDENDADTVRAFYHWTGMRLKDLGVGYIRTDHAGKDRSRGQRGTSAKRDDVDVIWSLKQRGNPSTGALLDCSGSSRLDWVGPHLELDRVETGGVVSYSTPIRIGWPTGTQTKAVELDSIGVPLDSSRRQAAAKLQAAGIPPGKTTVLAAALRYRIEQAGTTQKGAP